LVAQPVLDGARRVRGEEGLRGPDARERGPEILEILLQRRAPDVLERSDADGELPALSRAGERAPAASEVLGKVPRVARGDVERRGVDAGTVVAHLEAREPLAHVVGEVGLADLAVVDAVDAAPSLPADDLGDLGPQLRRKGVAVIGLAFC